MQLVLPVKRYLLNKHIKVPDEWLTACVDWVLSEYSRNQVPFIQDKVYQEWLHSDLTELATCCLPAQMQDQSSTTIVGYFPLQVNSVRDISEPAYAQLLKVEGVDTENSTVSATQTQTQTQSSREQKAYGMLMLEMTDGTTTVEGMSYRPTPNLNLNLSPGTKVLVFGTIKVRRGILFLTQHNIDVLGGKVINLLETNDQRNTLIAALNRGNEQQQQQQQRGNNVNEGQPNNHQERASHSSSTSMGTRGTRPHNGNSAPPASLDDGEFDFFDDAIESGFDQDMSLEHESIQDPAVESEFTQDLALENEFDEDLDEFMSQM